MHIAAMLDRSESTQARTRNSLRAEQGWQMMHGLEGWAAAALQRDREQDHVDSNNDLWANELPPIDLPGVRILGRMRELNGCFNLNNLAALDGTERTQWTAQFRRLLVALKLDESIAEQALDWIDADATPGSRGAEDMRLLAQHPPYRAANRPFAHVSELRLLPGVTAQVYKVLAPQVCALPHVLGAPDTGSLVNLNTATPEFWRSIDDKITPGIAQQLWREGQARYTGMDAVQQELDRVLGPGVVPLPTDQFGVTSNWFVLEAEIQADGIPFLYSALLRRTDNGTFVQARWRGRY